MDALKATFQTGQLSESQRFGGFENNEKKDVPEEKLKEIEAGAGIYKPFNHSDKYVLTEGDKGNIDIPEGKDVESKSIKLGDNKENGYEIKEINPDKTLINSPLLPVLDGLLSSNNITKKSYKETMLDLNSADKEDGLSILEGIVSESESIDFKDQKKILNGVSSSVEVTEENFKTTDFYKDFINKENGSKPEGSNLDLLLAESYTKIPNVKIEEALLTTMDITLNKLVVNNSESFRQSNGELINSIRNTENFTSKYILLGNLLKEVQKEKGPAGNKQSREFQKRKVESLNGIKTNEDFADYLSDYVKKNTFEAEQSNQNLIEIIDKLYNEPKKVISPDEKLEIFNEVKEILSEQA